MKTCPICGRMFPMSEKKCYFDNAPLPEYEDPVSKQDEPYAEIRPSCMICGHPLPLNGSSTCLSCYYKPHTLKVEYDEEEEHVERIPGDQQYLDKHDRPDYDPTKIVDDDDE